MKPVNTAKSKLTFIDVCRLLLDRKGWRFTGIMDEVTYRNTKPVFFLDQCCIVLRRDNHRGIVYQAGLSYFLFIFLCLFINPDKTK